MQLLGISVAVLIFIIKLPETNSVTEKVLALCTVSECSEVLYNSFITYHFAMIIDC